MPPLLPVSPSIEQPGFHAAWGTPSSGVAVIITSQREPNVQHTTTQVL